jgi:DNA-binding CsgD family transcriptional regulator
MPNPNREHRITSRELDILSAWWLLHTVRSVARFYVLSENTVKVHLMNARKRNGVHSTAALAQLFMGNLRTMDELVRSHNVERGAAA